LASGQLTAVAGALPFILVPRPGPESVWISPPRASMRSAIPADQPQRPVTGRGSPAAAGDFEPEPAVGTDKRTLARPVSACLAALRSASSAQKYTAASIACG
jgi:hypothetical protein